MLSCGHTFDSEFEIWILSFNFQIARRETARRQARNYANLDSVLDFDVPPYDRTRFAWVPPSALATCTLPLGVCMRLLLTYSSGF
jgi:hypothetical protein